MEQIDHSSRAHALLSASSAHRWLACPPSAVAASTYPQVETDYTAEGTTAHEVAEWVASGASKTQNLPLGQDDGVTPEMFTHAAAYRDYIHEHTTSDDAVVLLEQRVDFSPWVPDGFGTCDCIIIQGDTLTIIDYKYGVGVPVSAVDNPQMKLYALGALNDYGIAYDVKNVEMHIFQPRIDNVSFDRIGAGELISWANMKLKPTAAKAAAGKGDYTPGEHCRFCPHAGKCRALTKLCTEKVTVLGGLKTTVEKLAPFEIAEVLRMEPLISLWIKRVKEQALTDLQNGVDVPGYKVVEGKLGNRKWSNELDVNNLLIKSGFDREDITETKLLSPAAMDKKIGKKKVEELLSDLIVREPGAPTVVPSTDKRPALDRVAQAKKDFE